MENIFKTNDLVVLTQRPNAKVFTVKTVTGDDVEISFKMDTGEWMRPLMVSAKSLQLANNRVLAEHFAEELSSHGGTRKGAGRNRVDSLAKNRCIKLTDSHYAKLKSLGMQWLRDLLDK